ncbi:Uncharacterised protein [Vibrio cholerae]|uniref:Uncharacterized protein n=1 Tax=Vibrio cholerae TaxID=666 RepID=A0A655PIJ4_VIBCL|nr:Uncharacterised protein [Vibrio cholerae]CSB58201.1 Uncharacterised protein [Vibrio cholerae]CSB96267.1 Uncharacterised protein [Vibrio cholerae]CSC13842.1 Uncharacterised protein [Vibrio cholerae]CSC28095.1 Uncharacterised protein [Vibrio cholerae]
MHAIRTGAHALDLINDVHAFNHFTKHAVTPTITTFRTKIEESVVIHVNEEL